MEESKSNGGVDDDPGQLDGNRGSGTERKVSAVFQDRGSGSSKVAKLQEVFEDLREVDPEEGMPDGIAETAEDLVSAKVMNHPDRNYRLLVACCLVEVLRIYAPEAPYGEDQQLAIFALITTQLRGLCEAGESERFDMRTKLTKHLIQSLVHVKSCVILVFLTNDGVPGGLEQLIEMFEVLLTSVRETHPPELKVLVREALELCISELEDLPQPLLDTILIQLLPVTKNENPASYNLAKELLQSTFEKVHTPISVFVNSVLSGAAASANESELKEHVLPLVYELHKVHPLMLVYIFPELAQQLKAEDIEVRSGAVSLLGRLFMSKIGNYGVERPEIWQKFLGRFIDADVTIRSTMVTAGAMIARTKPELRKELYEALRRRLHDPDAEIRKDAVRELVELAHAEPEALSRDVLEAVGQRIKDRKPIIRQAACVGLGKAYNKHVSSKWVPSQDDTQHDLGGKPSRSKGKGKEKVVSLSLPSAELSSKLGWVPSFVVKALGYRDDWGLRAKVLELLDAYIVPKHLSDEARAVGLAHLRHGMDPPARQGLTWILQDKKKVRAEVLRYLDARDAHKASPKDKTLALAVEARLSAIMAIHPTNGTKMTPLHDLNNKVDKKVFRLLRAVCAADASHAMVAAARSELLKKVGSRTVVGEYVRTLAYRCSVLSVGAAGFQQLCLTCTKGLQDRNEESYLPPLGLLETLIGVFPEQARGQHEHLAAMFLAAQCSDLEEDATRVMSLIAAGRYCSEEQVAGVDRGEGASAKGKGGKGAEAGEEVPDEFLEGLVEICTKEGKGSPAQAPIAVRALAALANSDSAEIAEAARFAALDALRQAAEAAAAAVRRPSERSYQGVVASIAALSAFAQEFPQEFGTYEEKALSFVKARIAGGSGKRGEDEEGEDKGARGKAGGKAGKRRGGGRNAGSGAEISARCQTFCFSIELACSCFMPTAAGSGRAARAAAASLEVESLLKSVFGLLEAGGQPLEESEMSAEEREELRLVASTCVARLCMSSRSVVTSLSPERWHALAWTMMDPSERVRAEFTREVCRNLEQTGTSSGSSSGEREGGGAVSGSSGTSKLRFMAYLCLAAFEGEPLRSEVRLALAKKVRQLRMAHAAAATAAAAAASPGEGGNGGDEDEKAAAATALQAAMPEGVLPYVIHLLAHHPDYSSAKDDKKNIQRYLEFLLGPLLGQGHEADNLSMLLQMVDTIATSYQDALEPSNDRVHVTARVARQLLTNRIRTQSNLQPYPGKIFLPAPLFQRRARPSPESRKPRKSAVGRNQSSPEARAEGVGLGGRRASGGGSSSGSASSTSRRVRPRTSISSTSVPGSTTAVGAQSQGSKGRGRSWDTSKTRGDDRSLTPGSNSVSSSSLGLKSARQCRSKTPASSPSSATAVDAVTGATSPSLSPIAAHLDSPKLETRRGGGMRYRSADASQSPQWGSPVSSSSRSSSISGADSKYSQSDSGAKGEEKISTPRGQPTTSSRRSPPRGGLTIGTGDSAAVSRRCSIGTVEVSGSRTVRAMRRSTIALPQGEPERLTQRQQQQASRKRAGRSPSSTVAVGSMKGPMSIKGGRRGHKNVDIEADEEDSTGPSPAKKGRQDNGRPTVSAAAAPAMTAATSAGEARQGKNVGRKTPLAARQQQQSAAAAGRAGAKGTKKKSTASSGRGAGAGASASTSATAAGPARERKQPAARVASTKKRAVRDWTPAEPLSRQERAERRARGASVEEKPESAKGGEGKKEEEEEDSDDEALMELARRRRAAMQE